MPRSPSPSAADDSVDEDFYRSRSQSRSARRRKQRKQQQGNRLPAVEEAHGTAQRAITKAKGMTGAATKPDEGGKGGEDGGKKDTLSLRLDVNLSVELTIKLKVHGDLTLALLN